MSELETERAAVERDEREIAQRRHKLSVMDAERSLAISMLERAGLLRLDLERLDAFTTRLALLGIEEVEKRMCSLLPTDTRK